ncbi:MAG: TIGR02147 family protein [Halobacteriovoraceae bacterium]|jgi:uncharacterized protein (TIGR02147 family)|nr:TIGR02147 family protein [Halobacteriovoraceae bacterium]MBT5096145.1 TIGR02147 family protein [Halobacteriovoraceae bacterium]
MQKNNETPVVSIFDFSDFRAYLLAVGMPDGLYAHSNNNLKEWSKRLGYRSPSTLSMVLQGQRLPSYQLIRALTEDLDLSSKEREYFELLVFLEKQKNKNKNPEKTFERLSELRGGQDQIDISLEQFKCLSCWYYTPIRQLIANPDFIEDTEWIAKKLRYKVTAGQIKTALKNLEEVGLLARDKLGRLQTVARGIETPNGTESAALQQHHAGMLNRAMEALEEIPVNERQFNGLTFSMPEEKEEEAKEYLLRFLKEFNQKFSQQGSGEIFQLNVQIFPHSKKVYKQ